jgi:hypothetical protein
MQLQPLILNNPDIAHLQEDGFLLRVDGNYLLVDHIPYLNPEKKVCFGTLVCVLPLATPDKLAPANGDHTAYFIGEKPCDPDGNVLKAINNSNKQVLSSTISVDHYLSSKLRPEGYMDYYEKLATYADIFNSQARFVDPKSTARPNKKNYDG